MSDACCGSAVDAQFVADKRRRRMLVIVLAINAAMFAVELAAGLWAGSTALQADSLDMLADSLVYSVSLFAVTRGPRLRAAAGMTNGVLELLLGLVVLAQVAHHLMSPVEPMGTVIMSVAAIALVANLVCAGLLIRFRHDDINMRAVWLCTRNDCLGNAGTIAAGALVLFSHSKWPDLVIGAALAALFIRTAVGVVREALSEMRAARTVPSPRFTRGDDVS